MTVVMKSREEIQSMIVNASDLEMELVWLPKIMGNQTDDEVDKRATLSDNKIGLTGGDAPFVTAYWMRLQRGVHLTHSQVEVLKCVLPKYWRQFARMMNNGK